jgi:SAM-dependent methyltransferase
MMYVCPDCKGPLQDWHCTNCSVTFGERAGVRELLSRAPRFASAHTIGGVYDSIYTHRSQVWEDQGRTPQFIAYFADLAAACSTGRLLEIGCGEGFLLEKLRGSEKVAIDVSAEALQRAHARSGAQVSVALAERLPFASKSFDLIVTVGVMEHFLDDRAATEEIGRVLKDAGWYLALIHVQRTARQKALQKLHEYVYPHFRPRALLRWIGSKLHRPIQQPIQNDYTTASARALLEGRGFEVVRVISRALQPTAPLIGPHVIIYISRRRAELARAA